MVEAVGKIRRMLHKEVAWCSRSKQEENNGGKKKKVAKERWGCYGQREKEVAILSSKKKVAGF